MDWVNIQEGVVSGLISTAISGLITYAFTKFVLPKLRKEAMPEDVRPRHYKYDLFVVALFLTSFAVVLAFFSMVYNWVVFNFAYMTIAAVILGIVTVWIYDNQCPGCKNIFTKKLLRKETVQEEKRPYHYRDLIIYLYSDGSEKERKYVGKEKTRMETWRQEKEYYACTACNQNWDKIFERNLSESSRPKPNVIKTKVRPSSPF